MGYLCGHRFPIPIIAAAMDGVVSPSFAIERGRVGGLAVLNLEAPRRAATTRVATNIQSGMIYGWGGQHGNACRAHATRDGRCTWRSST
jgi:IMP dehydrogenase/GMP reductase